MVPHRPHPHHVRPKYPRLHPTSSPIKSPARFPTHPPTLAPTQKPTKHPTNQPNKQPTHNPTRSPTHSPSAAPTKVPSSVLEDIFTVTDFEIKDTQRRNGKHIRCFFRFYSCIGNFHCFIVCFFTPNMYKL